MRSSYDSLSSVEGPELEAFAADGGAAAERPGELPEPAPQQEKHDTGAGARRAPA
jgi:hypothetical protein